MASQGKTGTILGAAGLVLAAISLVVVILIYTSLPKEPDENIVADARKLAGEMADNNLPEAAIAEYENILERASLTQSERGAINYLIGKTYFEDIGDYEKAAAYYIRARSLDSEASYTSEAGKNLITCLEKMGRRLDARRELDRQASAEPDSVSEPGKLVAKVGSHDITRAEFNRAVQNLPAEMQDEMTDFETRRKFLDQLIGRELIYHAALREGMDDDPGLKKDLKELEKEYLVQHYTRVKIAPTVRPDSAELMMYYKANKDKFDNKEFDEVRDRVMRDYVNYIGQKAIDDYIGTLLEAEPVQVFEENLK